MNKIKKIIKKCFFHKESISPIVDYVSYASIVESYCGASLAESNILVVTNDATMACDYVEQHFAKEHASTALLNVECKLGMTDIIDAGNELIGTFTHIINILRFDEQGSLLNADGTYNENDTMRLAYQWCQVETDYLVGLSCYATLCMVYIHSESVESAVIGSGISHLVSGLAKVLSPHGIICNGVIASPSVSIEAWLSTATFLTGKYGQIMTGEVLNME